MSIGTAAPESQPGSVTGARLTLAGLVVLMVLCAVTLVFGFLNKDRCTGPAFDEWGRSQPDFESRRYEDICYSDIQTLWIGRSIDRHVFPYVDGKLTADGQPIGGVVEYPVLTGVFIWASAIFADTDADFLLLSALLLAPFGLATAWLLGRMSGWRSLLWAAGPPLVMYAFLNWELPVVLCATAAFYVMHFGWGARQPLLKRATVAAVFLGLGFAFKLYPAIFVLPLMLYVLTGGQSGSEFAGRWKGALRVAAVALGTAVAANVPFVLAGFEGWLASFEFQLQRKADITTNSIWFWGTRPDTDQLPVQDLIGLLSPLLMTLSFAAACAIGWLRYKREGTYPWIPVSAAMLCGFLLLHKVHSPQYMLWLVPMFVLLRIRWGWIVAYYVADLAMGIGIFRWYYQVYYGNHASMYEGFAAQAVMVGVWGRAVLLIGLFFAFLAAKETFPPKEGPQAPSKSVPIEVQPR